jgi:peroxiredoxin
MMKPVVQSVFMALGLILQPASAQAQEESPFDSKALELLTAFSKPLAAADTYSLEFSTQVELTVQGRKETMASAYRLTVDRPDRFLLELIEGETGANISSDGSELTLHVPALKRYMQIAAPDSLDDLFDREDFLALLAAVAAEGLELLPAFMHSRPKETLLKEVLKLEWLGEEALGEETVRRLRFTQEHFDWDILLSKDTPPRLLYFKPDFAKVVKATKEAMPHVGEFAIEASTRYSHWTEAPTGTVFSVKLPDDAVKVKGEGGVFEAPGQGGADAASLKGAPAPDFTLDNLAGESITFSDLEGHKVLILDFWATWCAPCVAALPHLAALAAEYEDRGVRLFALNQGEAPERIRSFLETQKLDLEVLFDENGEVGSKYRVQGIPQTVIIDEKGVVLEVHIGYLPQLKQQLAAEIDALLRE